MPAQIAVKQAIISPLMALILPQQLPLEQAKDMRQNILESANGGNIRHTAGRRLGEGYTIVLMISPTRVAKMAIQYPTISADLDFYINICNTHAKLTWQKPHPIINTPSSTQLLDTNNQIPNTTLPNRKNTENTPSDRKTYQKQLTSQQQLGRSPFRVIISRRRDSRSLTREYSMMGMRRLRPIGYRLFPITLIHLLTKLFSCEKGMYMNELTIISSCLQELRYVLVTRSIKESPPSVTLIQLLTPLSSFQELLSNSLVTPLDL